jgi:hypothetical protein
VASVELDGETVILDEREDSLHLLNPTAATIWRCLDGAGTVGELISDLSEAFGSDPQTIRHDVSALLADFAAQGLIESDSESTRAVSETGANEAPHWSGEPPGS